VELKTHREGGGRILLGDDLGAVMLWPIRFQCVWSLDCSRTSLHI